MKIKIKCDSLEVIEDIKTNNFCINNDDFDYILIKKNQNTINCYKNKAVTPIKVQEIYYFESYGNDVFSVTKFGSSKVKEKLYELERLYPFGFIRISKSVIANKSHIKKILPTMNMKLILEMNNEVTVYVTRNYYHKFKEEMNI